jgi:hypothetical protein
VRGGKRRSNVQSEVCNGPDICKIISTAIHTDCAAGLPASRPQAPGPDCRCIRATSQILLQNADPGTYGESGIPTNGRNG